MWMRSTANHAMARNMGQKAMASEVEPALWVWTQERDLESSLKYKLLIALQITPTPPSLPREQGAQMCVLDVAPQCTQRRRSSVEAIPGIRAAFVVASVAKDWSPRPLLIETERSTVKVVTQRTLVPRDLALDRVQELWLIPSKVWSHSPPGTDIWWSDTITLGSSSQYQGYFTLPFHSSYRQRGMKETHYTQLFAHVHQLHFAPYVALEFGL